MQERIEIRDGRAFVVKVLPEATPPKYRSQRTRFHLHEVGRAGDIQHPNKGKRKKKRPG